MNWFLFTDIHLPASIQTQYISHILINPLLIEQKQLSEKLQKTQWETEDKKLREKLQKTEWEEKKEVRKRIKHIEKLKKKLSEKLKQNEWESAENTVKTVATYSGI